MSPPPERRWLGPLAGYLALMGLLALAMTPVYFSATPSYKPVVVRLFAAIFGGVVLLHLLRIAGRWIEAQPPSDFERALGRAPAEPVFAPLILKLRDEVRSGLTNHRYFERVLWPRILALRARLSGGAPQLALEMPSGRRLLRRGPSLAALRDLIARIEERL